MVKTIKRSCTRKKSEKKIRPTNEGKCRPGWVMIRISFQNAPELGIGKEWSGKEDRLGRVKVLLGGGGLRGEDALFF